MSEPADEPQRAPASMARRRLLVAGGLGAASWAVLRSLPDRADGPAALGASGTDGTTTTTVQVREPQQPPALEGAEPAPPADHTYDMVIGNGRVLDPDTGFDQVAHVGIDGGTIRAISVDAPLTGRTTIDARDLVVAPGFIDILSYEPNDFGVWYKVADGVTSNLGMHGINSTADDFFAIYETRVPIHFGGAFDDPYMRSQFAALSDGTTALPYQIDQLAELARSGFESGWLGIDLEPEYTPGVGTEEIVGLASVAAEYGRPVFFHARYSEPDQNLQGITEILDVARSTGVGVHIDHLTSTGGTFTMEETLATIQAARDEGIDVTACVYPYDFWATFLQSPRLGPDPVTGAPITDRYGIGWDDLVVPGSGEILTEATYNTLRANGQNPLVAALSSIPEEEIEMALRTDWIMIGSDAIPDPAREVIAGQGAIINNHPRASGCFARTLGRYSRDRGVMDLRAALAKMTILPARRLEGAAPAMARKGRLQRGADADITIFDPETIIDTSTLEEPARESEGIAYVLVMGQVVIDPDGAKREVLAGQALKA